MILNHCQVCIRECEFGRSFCHRRDDNGQLIKQETYNSILIDTLFDKPIIHFSENKKILSIGSWGCNLRCPGCQNAGLSWSADGSGLDAIEMTPDKVVDIALSNHCEGICFTFNEPAILPEAVMAVSSEARGKGLFTVLVTNSTLTSLSVSRIAPLIDAVAADIKSLNDEFYFRYCGAAGITGIAGKILQCIRDFARAGCHLEIRTNIIPGGNDGEANYRMIARWIRTNIGENTPWHITRFFPAHMLSHLQPTELTEMETARNTGLKEGLKNVYLYSDKGCDCADEKIAGGYLPDSIINPAHGCCKNYYI